MRAVSRERHSCSATSRSIIRSIDIEKQIATLESKLAAYEALDAKAAKAEKLADLLR